MPDNRDIVARHYTATSEGRTADALADFAPDITWIEMAGSPYAGTFVGVDAIVANVFARIEAEHETFAFVPDRLLGDGDTVAAVGTYLGRRITGEEVSARAVHVWGLEGGTIVRFEQFADTARLRPDASRPG